MTARAAAVQILLQIECAGAYSNIALNHTLKTAALADADKALCTTLVYGVSDRLESLDYILTKYLSKPLKKLSPMVRAVLRVTLFQLMFLDRIPDHAAVNEAVELVKHSRERYAAGLVNAVLRAYLRAPAELPQGNEIENLEIRFSCPAWIIEGLMADYGLETTLAYLADTIAAPPLLLHTNILRISPAALCGVLSQEGVSAEPIAETDFVRVSGGMNVAESKAFADGLFFVQDIACARAVAALRLRPGDRVLDLCAAPGGKSFAAALAMQNNGCIDSLDYYAQRAALIADGANRLGFSCIHAAAADATVFVPQRENQYTAVICDVPCSGWGVLRRKPEIKRHAATEAAALPALQQSILQNAVRYVAPGGRLLYSTCTLRRAENEEMTAWLLKHFPAFSCEYEHTYFPHTDGTDGFYCACLVKRESLLSAEN